MKYEFTKEQLNLLSKINLPFSVQKNLTDEEDISLSESVADYLLTEGLDDKGEVDETGFICEDILAIVNAD